MSIPSSLDRRRLLQGLAGTGAAAAALALAGCESAVQAARADVSDSPPQRGGRAVIGIITDLVPANFFTNSNAGVTTIIGLAYESLVRYPQDRVEPTPRLATAWQLAADGLSITLDLRRDVRFHSGRPFVAADVEASIRAYGDDVSTAQLKRTARAIVRYRIEHDHRITLVFDHPLSNVFDLLDTAPIIDRDTLPQLRLGEQYNGTGPFRVTRWQPNSAITFDRNDAYWQPDRPWLDGVDALVIKDGQSMRQALRSGQIQLADGMSYLDLERIAKEPGFTATTMTGAEKQVYVGANLARTPLEDLRLRRAIAYALDRERVVAEVLRGSGYPINLPWPTYSPAFDAARNTTYRRDLDKAKALVAEVVADRGPLPTLPYTYTAGNPVLEAMSAIVQANLADVGIPVDLDPVDNAQFVKLLIGAEFKGIWSAFHSWAQYTPSTLTVSAYPFNAARNASRFTSPAYTRYAEGAWKVADGTSTAAKEQYAGISTELIEQLFLIEIAVVQGQYGVASRLRGIDWTKRSELVLTDAWLTGT